MKFSSVRASAEEQGEKAFSLLAQQPECCFIDAQLYLIIR